MYTYMYDIHVCIHTCMSYMYTYIHTYIHVHMYIHICILYMIHTYILESGTARPPPNNSRVRHSPTTHKQAASPTNSEIIDHLSLPIVQFFDSTFNWAMISSTAPSRCLFRSCFSMLQLLLVGWEPLNTPVDVLSRTAAPLTRSPSHPLAQAFRCEVLHRNGTTSEDRACQCFANGECRQCSAALPVC